MIDFNILNINGLNSNHQSCFNMTKKTVHLNKKKEHPKGTSKNVQLKRNIQKCTIMKLKEKSIEL